ncbi:hypothetical protein [Endozoicomonas lisbonensis]|uniref:Transposase n=1 Tax=Endozoicomonas lisbonensis TaxID=3120522 RepID=A0ABV2SL71_9GAMM
MIYTKTVVKHLIRALEDEVVRMDELTILVMDDDWPYWFDANDRIYYTIMLDYLNKFDFDEPVYEPISSKPFRFMMYIMEPYIKEQAGKVPDSEIKELIAFSNDYEKQLPAEYRTCL